jgi:hypothetical protein
MRRRSRVRCPKSSKPDTCTEGYDVDPTGISVKVVRHTRGDLHACLELPTSRGVGMRMQKSANGIVGRGRGGKPERALTEGPNIEQRD